MARAKQPVSIDGIEFDALIDQSISYEADVPEYSTEKGYSVCDTIILKPETMSMTLFVTNMPVTWKSRFGSSAERVENVIKQLEQLYFAKKVFSVVTSDEVYDNMVLTSISISKSADVGYAREIPISLKRIVVTESKTVTIPSSYGKSGTTAVSAGTASTTSSSKSSSSSSAKTTSSKSSSSSSSSSSSKSTSSSSGKTSKSSNSSSSNKKSGSILYNASKSAGLI